MGQPFDYAVLEQFASQRMYQMFQSMRSDDERKMFWQFIQQVLTKIPTIDCYTMKGGHFNFNFGVKQPSQKGNVLIQFYVTKQAIYVLSKTTRLSHYTKQYHGHCLSDMTVAQLQNLQDDLIKDYQLVDQQGHGYRPIDFDENAFIEPEIDTLPASTDSLLFAVNKIFYGAAGTGKTYRLQKLQRAYTEQLTQQDHATFLAEKLRDLTWRDVICLVFLAEKNRLLRAPEIRDHELFRAKVKINGREKNLLEQIRSILQTYSPLDSLTINLAKNQKRQPALFDKDEAGLWRLLDPQDDPLKELYELLSTLKRGAQPSETIERFGFVTFHQSYGYEDFIEGLRPVLNDDSDDGQVRYEIRQGVFVELCERARRDPEHGYALFIDEINRGNVSKILGELITLIELDKREGQPNAIRVRLPYSGEWFSVPANLSIYGSMNSADRSLTPLDTALRRRFEFEEILPDPSLLAGRLVEGVALDQLLTVINARIELLLGHDCLLGHAYFDPVHSFADLQTVMQQQIVPQLQEYFFDDWRKIRWVLNDHRKPERLQFIHEHDPQAQILALFGQELDVAIQPTYALNATAFNQIDSYRMIIAV